MNRLLFLFDYLAIKNMTNVSYVGCDQERVDCSVVHHQDCTYSWLSETGAELTSSSTIKLTDRPDGNYTCLAKCNVRQTPCSYVAKIFYYQCSRNSKLQMNTNLNTR